MMNQNVVVGRIVNKPILMENDDVKHTCLTLSVPRSYKNELGEYDIDFVNVVLNNGIAINTTEYCHQGDLIGVRGRLQTRTIENEESKKSVMEVVAERVTFLSSKKPE